MGIRRTTAYTYADFACFGGHRRHFLPPHSHFQPEIADDNISCWGIVLNFFAFFAPQAQHNRAQRSQPAQAAKQVRVDQSATTQASRQSWREPSCHRAFTQLAVFSKRTKKSKSVRTTKLYNRSRSSLAGVMLPVHCSFSPSFVFRPCMRRPGCFRGS